MSDDVRIESWLEDFVGKLLEHAGFDLWVEELAIGSDENELRLELGGPDAARAIGRDGQMLDALQYLVTAAAAHAGMSGRRILLDIEGYRKRREDRVREQAERAATEALERGEPFDLEPMSPRERRLVHLTVAGIEGIVTESHGEGDERYVRLLPKSK
ncbi:MAG: KH domain-containing protein [Deltaproteobacteria bacterium]|nr:KH domain-containing protein [Deltaproteobacteria bacterium]